MSFKVIILTIWDSGCRFSSLPDADCFDEGCPSLCMSFRSWHASTHNCYFCDCQVKSDIFPIHKENLVRTPASSLSSNRVTCSLICSLPSVATCCIYAPDCPGFILLIEICGLADGGCDKLVSCWHLRAVDERGMLSAASQRALADETIIIHA